MKCIIALFVVVVSCGPRVVRVAIVPSQGLIICPPAPPRPGTGTLEVVRGKPLQSEGEGAQPARPTVPDDGPLDPINRFLEDAFFDFDRYDLRSDAVAALQEDAVRVKRILEALPSLMLIVEGHCDELGSAEYNLALGERRAEVARDFLVQLGIPRERMRTVTFGKEHPVCTETTDACRQRNRRAHAVYSDSLN
ncbi:MAG: OmpA family protein [Acidobacteria bacterium]|nr:OmpA family protein [Acidobacteriota bacterium]